MDESLQRDLRRQLRFIKVLLAVLTIFLLSLVVVLAVLTWQAVTFAQRVEQRITTIQQTAETKLDIKKQFCDQPTKNYFVTQLCE